jgi:hypothetical protein
MVVAWFLFVISEPHSLYRDIVLCKQLMFLLWSWIQFNGACSHLMFWLAWHVAVNEVHRLERLVDDI